MADIFSAVRSILIADGNVSTTVGTRIYDELPQGVSYPAISYELIDDFPFTAMDGMIGVAEAYFEIRVHAETRAACTALEEYVRLALGDASGTYSSVVVSYVHSGRGSASVERPIDGSDGRNFVHDREYHMYYAQAT